MIAAGIDLGSIKPACAIVRVGDVSPTLRDVRTPNYTKLEPSERQATWNNELFCMLASWKGQGLTRVVIEDAS